MVEQKLHQLWGEARQTAAVLHAGSCGRTVTTVRKQSDGASHDDRQSLSPLISCSVARVAKAHKDGRLGVLKGLLGGEGCPWEGGGCPALWRRSTAARPAATGAIGAPASSTSTASSSGASLK